MTYDGLGHLLTKYDIWRISAVGLVSLSIAINSGKRLYSRLFGISEDYPPKTKRDMSSWALIYQYSYP